MGNYVILDLEMCMVPKTAWSGMFRMNQETIQIGAVMLNDSFEIVSEFNELVKPQYGYVNTLIKDLTGISNEMLEHADSFENVLKRFSDWMTPDAECVSWSTNDLTQIRKEMKQKEIINDSMSSRFEGWIDCQKMFSDKLDTRKSKSLSEALTASDINSRGKEHDGYYDAYNTALLFRKLKLTPDYALNPYYASCKEEAEPMCFSLGNLFSGLNLEALPA